MPESVSLVVLSCRSHQQSLWGPCCLKKARGYLKGWERPLLLESVSFVVCLVEVIGIPL